MILRGQQCISRRCSCLLLETLYFLIDVFSCKKFSYNEQNCLLCSQRWWWCFKIIPFCTLSPRKVSIRVLESECMLDSLMHGDLVEMLTRRWQLSIPCTGRWARGLSKTRPTAVPTFTSQQEQLWNFSTRKCTKKWGKHKNKSTQKHPSEPPARTCPVTAC